jgi:hypothetical protein
LNLDSFDLLAARPVEAEDENAASPAGSWAKMLKAGVPVGHAFWAGVEGKEDEDTQLLRAVFDPSLSDRRDEGERFVPPSPSPAYVDKLARLVHEEEEVRLKRRDLFLSEGFDAEKPGPMFPAVWATRFSQQDSREAVTQCPEKLCRRSDLLAEANLALQATAPTFDAVSEDGERFRTYRCDGLEIRTTAAPGSSEEVVGAVFSVDGAPSAQEKKPRPSADDDDRVVKFTEYVEKVPKLTNGLASWQFYVVLETEGHALVAVERRSEDGSLRWSSGEERRNALAKVVRSANCTSLPRLGDLRSLTGAQSGWEQEHFARELYSQACGTKAREGGWGDEARKGKRGLDRYFQAKASRPAARADGPGKASRP